MNCGRRRCGRTPIIKCFTFSRKGIPIPASRPRSGWAAPGAAEDAAFDPYTGLDLGDSVPWEYRFFLAATEFHGSLVGGPKGRTANGIGAIFLTVMGLTGLVLWWPGVTRWRRALTIDWKANWKRVNWDLHSAIGIWMAAFVLLWGITGSYLVFPVPFEKAVNQVFPLKQYRPIPEAALGGKAGVRLIRVADIRVADDDEPIRSGPGRRFSAASGTGCCAGFRCCTSAISAACR